MPLWMFVLQAIVIGATMFLLAPRVIVLQAQILVWTAGVITIATLYGIEGQTRFYSNDQVLHTSLVYQLRNWTLPADFFLLDGRLPYLLPAVPLSHIGINETLALKTISLICLLVLTRELLSRYPLQQVRGHLKILYLSGCGLIGSFFSMLALRETMMMLSVYLFVNRRTPVTRSVSIVVIALLRPHLAVALLVAEMLVGILAWLKTPRFPSFLFSPLLMILGATIGNSLFYLGRGDLARGEFVFLQGFGLDDIRQIASNFVGLQFLTTGEWNVNFSITSLVFLRVVFSETVLIPAMFLIVTLVAGPLASRRQHMILTTFTIYVGIATSTDFNSFRQNIPLIPLMGTAVLDYLEQRRRLRQSAASGGSARNQVVATMSPPET